MAKEDQIKADATKAGIDPDTAAKIHQVESAPAPQPFVPSAPRRVASPTAEQHAWMAKNPHYKRASHYFGRMINRGTLHADGSFIPEGTHPMMDGPECFGVGIPTT